MWCPNVILCSVFQPDGVVQTDGDNLIDMEHCFLELIDPITLEPMR